jgi:putative transposase
MPRLARVVVPDVAHHATQRGNRRLPTFFGDEDYTAYRGLLAEWAVTRGVEVWAYCLVPSHVHLVAVPATQDALRRALGEAHRRYSRRVNFREGWRGHLWQGRFASFPLDQAHLSMMATRYVELNSVRARLVSRPEDYPWSSAAARLCGRDDALVRVAPLLERFEAWGEFLAGGLTEEKAGLLRRHERTGRPLSGESLLVRLEALLGRLLRPQKRGPRGPRSHSGPEKYV